MNTNSLTESAALPRVSEGEGAPAPSPGSAPPTISAFTGRSISFPGSGSLVILDIYGRESARLKRGDSATGLAAYLGATSDVDGQPVTVFITGNYETGYVVEMLS